MNLAKNFNISSSARAPSYLFVPSLTELRQIEEEKNFDERILLLLTSVEHQPWVTGDALAPAQAKLLLGIGFVGGGFFFVRK